MFLFSGHSDKRTEGEVKWIWKQTNMFSCFIQNISEFIFNKVFTIFLNYLSLLFLKNQGDPRVRINYWIWISKSRD